MIPSYVMLRTNRYHLLTLHHGCFSRFVNCTNGTKTRKASHIGSTPLIWGGLNVQISWLISIWQKHWSLLSTTGFRKTHSTDFCLTISNKKTPKGVDGANLTDMVLIKLQKAFATNEPWHNLEKNPCKLLVFSEHSINLFHSTILSTPPENLTSVE